MNQTSNTIRKSSGDAPETVSLAATQDLLPDLCHVRAVLWLILFSEALVLVMILLSSGALTFSWMEFGTLSMYVQWVVLLTAASLCRVRLHVQRLSLNQLMLLSFVVILSVNLMISLAAMWGLNRVIGENLGLDWVLRNQIISALVGGLLLHYFYAQLQWRLQARSELQSRVQALQSRIRPHFLFNSMNIIASLIHEDPDKAEQAVEDLSELFRASLKEAGAEVPLEQELSLCRKYVHIEQLRLNDRLHIDWQIDESTLDTHLIKIPMLTLQPLIENAIYHGIQPSVQGGTVTVKIIYADNWVRITVSNPLPSKIQSIRHEKGNHMALENTRYRLQALYGEEISMGSYTKADRFEFELAYPFRLPAGR